MLLLEFWRLRLAMRLSLLVTTLIFSTLQELVYRFFNLSGIGSILGRAFSDGFCMVQEKKLSMVKL